ncbi:vitellogenin-like [Procambarus clarkii]|uniref:vitellogenin-like n=1 Tax=Procambarus clarkii TaxID=6728 RepID=UPI003744496B
MAPIKINSSSAAELLLLPGVGDTLAARIIKFRRRHVIMGDNIYDINRLRATPDLMAAISFEVDPSQQGPGPLGQGAGSRSSSSSSETGTRHSSRGAASSSQRGRRPQSPAYSRASGQQGTRQGSPSHHRSARSRRRTARHSSHSSLTSDSDASLSRSRRTGYRQQKETFRTPPRALDYDGKSDWATFYRRFTSYASEKDWSGPTSLTQLGWCLKGKDKTLAEYIANARNSSMEEAIDRAQTFQHNAVAIHGSASSSRHDSHRRGSQGPAVRVNAVGRYSRCEQPPRRKDASRRSTPGASPATSPAGRGTGTHHPSSAGSGPSSSMDTEAKLDVLVAGVSELSGKLDQAT